MLEELKKMNEELEQLRVQHLEKSKILFGEISKKLFEKHPKLESFSWPQYTPYFNDGDECVFRASTEYNLIINEQEDHDNEGNLFEDEFITEYGEYDETSRSYPNKKQIPNENYDKELCDALNDVREFMYEFDEDVLKQLFGDHVKVIVKKDGVETEEYEHD